MKRVHHLPAVFAVTLVALAMGSVQPAPVPATPVSLEPVPPPHWVEVESFFETRLVSYSDQEVKRMTRTVLREAERYAIDPLLIIGLIQVESSGRLDAVSHVGAMGLMQLRPATAAQAAKERGIEFGGKESLFDPVLNIQLGVHYLAGMIERFGDIDTALAAYNFGPTRIARAIRKGKSVPVRYAQAVHRAYPT